MDAPTTDGHITLALLFSVTTILVVLIPYCIHLRHCWPIAWCACYLCCYAQPQDTAVVSSGATAQYDGGMSGTLANTSA